MEFDKQKSKVLHMSRMKPFYPYTLVTNRLNRNSAEKDEKDLGTVGGH